MFSKPSLYFFLATFTIQAIFQPCPLLFSSTAEAAKPGVPQSEMDDFSRMLPSGSSPEKSLSKSLLEISSTPDVFFNYGPFISQTLIPTESIYFKPGIGLDPNTGLPFDHVRIRLRRGELGEKGNYTAASKVSLSIPYLLGVMKRKPAFEKATVDAPTAKELLHKALKTIRRYQKEFPDYGGFLAWSDIRPNGTIAPAFTKMPSLDNGQMSWALAAVVASLENSSDSEEREMGALAQEILDNQNYSLFYDSVKGLMHGTIQINPYTKKWFGDKTYYLNDMFEGTLAVLWAVLHGHVPEDAWNNLSAPTVDYVTANGEVVTTLQGFRASFHEHWGLIFLPLMKSPLAPVYQNYLYVQADFARNKGLPGFLSTAFDANGNYRQMGIPAIAAQPVDRSDVSVVFATALAMMISPTVGAKWLHNIYNFRGIVTPFGAVESVAHDGYSDIMTADGKGLTVMAATGGVINEVERYLMTHKVPGTETTMYAKLLDLFYAKSIQMLKERKNEPIHMPKRPYPMPSQNQIAVAVKNIPTAGEEYVITDHFQAGHLHGKNVHSLNTQTLEDDVKPGKNFEFGFDIPAYFPYFDQWAFRGTYLDRAIGIAGMKYLTVSIPADTIPLKFNLEIKSDDINLTNVTIDTLRPGLLSEDGKWKTYVEKVKIIPEADYKPMNYFSVTIHDPSYLTGQYADFGRQGKIVLKKIFLSRKHPFNPEEDKKKINPLEVPKPSGDVEVMQYWRMSHGEMTVLKDEARNVYTFPGGRGWKGGYLPYISLDKYRFLHLKIRNRSSKCNCFYLELKNENNQILTKKMAVKLAGNKLWHTYEIPLPNDLSAPLNYVAFSDPLGTYELSSVSFSDIALDRAEESVVFLAPDTEMKCSDACENLKAF